MVRLGDFTVPAAALESATEQYGERSDEARAADERRRAPVTTDAQEYSRRPGELDFPGVDTPREAPPLLPKDQMRKGAELSLSGRASGRLPADVMGLSRDAEVRDQELAERGVPASKDEADFGTGAVGMTAIGGFDEVSGGEKDPLYAGTGPLSDREMNDVTRDEQRIGELALENGPYDGQPMPFGGERDDRQFIFEEEGVGEQMTFGEFTDQVDTVKKQMGGAADDFTASQIVSKESADGGVDIFGDADAAVEKMEEESGGWF